LLFPQVLQILLHAHLVVLCHAGHVEGFVVQQRDNTVLAKQQLDHPFAFVLIQLLLLNADIALPTCHAKTSLVCVDFLLRLLPMCLSLCVDFVNRALQQNLQLGL